MASYDPDFRGVDPDKAPPGYDVEPRRRGCLFYGCVVAIVLAVLVMLGLALAALAAYRIALQYRDRYTATAPVALPRSTLTEPERERAVSRIARFRDDVEAGRDVGPLALTGDDLNALIQESPKLKDWVYLSLDKDKIKAKVSFPLSEIKDFSLTRGRYLNGEAEVKLALRDGTVDLDVVSMVFDGKDLPEVVRDMLAEIVRDVLAESNVDLDDDDEDDTEAERRIRAFLRRIESLEVKDGVMIVTPRKPREPGDEARPDPPAPPDPPIPPEPAARSAPNP